MIKAVAFIPLSEIADEQQIEIISTYLSFTFGTNAHSLVSIEVFAAVVDSNSFTFEPLKGLFRKLESLDESLFVDLET